MTAMTQHHIQTRAGLPSEMQALLRDLPRDDWPGHPHFRRPTAQWMRAHEGFRMLGAVLERDSERFLDGHLDGQVYARRVADLGHSLVRSLHGHHTWEDRTFFPELEAADPRFADGLAMLEADHVALDGLIDEVTHHGNRVVKLATLAPDQMREDAGPLRDVAERMNGFLDRHLTDEEDLVVPIVLHHKLRG